MKSLSVLISVTLVFFVLSLTFLTPILTGLKKENAFLVNLVFFAYSLQILCTLKKVRDKLIELGSKLAEAEKEKNLRRNLESRFNLTPVIERTMRQEIGKQAKLLVESFRVREDLQKKKVSLSLKEFLHNQSDIVASVNERKGEFLEYFSVAQAVLGPAIPRLMNFEDYMGWAETGDLVLPRTGGGVATELW